MTEQCLVNRNSRLNTKRVALVGYLFLIYVLNILGSVLALCFITKGQEHVESAVQRLSESGPDLGSYRIRMTSKI